jgi:Raf kinase inhibitor-like YbhB/YbcL family protein
MDASLLVSALDPASQTLALAAALVFACGLKTPSGPVTLTVESPSFADGGMIPVRHTCDGRGLSPEILLTGVPAGAKSLALLGDDPDAPAGDFVHWLIFNIPPSTRKLAEGVGLEYLHAIGATPGANGWGKLTYGGPCPPSGTHRYFFTVYALAKMLDLPPGTGKTRFREEIHGHILAEGRLMGRYGRL